MKITPKQVADLLAAMGLNREQLTWRGPNTRGDHEWEMNDRVKVVLFTNDSPIILIPSLTPEGLKLEYMLVVKNEEDAKEEDGSWGMDDAFWIRVLDELDQTDAKSTYNLRGDESTAEFMEALANEGVSYYKGDRKDLLEARSLSYWLSKLRKEIPEDQTFAEFMKDDPWVGRVTNDEFDPKVLDHSIIKSETE